MDRDILENVSQRRSEYIDVLRQLDNATFMKALRRTADAYRRGNFVYVCGNGGSAADAQHFAAELRDTPAMGEIRFRALAFNDSGSITAMGNDYSFETIFERQLRTLGRNGDVLYGISTSGKAVNVQRALDAALELGIYRIGIVGNGPMSREIIKRSDTAIVVPSKDTQIIQQCCNVVFHDIWIELKEIFGA